MRTPLEEAIDEACGFDREKFEREQAEEAAEIPAIAITSRGLFSVARNDVEKSLVCAFLFEVAKKQGEIETAAIFEKLGRSYYERAKNK